MRDRTENSPGTMVRLQTVGRRALLGTLLVCGLLILVRAVTMSGWTGPIRVVSGSMAARLWGPHYRIVCRDCGMAFRAGTDAPLADGQVVCPNCGARNECDGAAPVHAGCRVLIDRVAYWWRRPRVWEAVAYRNQRDKDWLTVKRVVAGPGARVSIRGGDVFVNGRVQAKSMAQLRDVRILVHDDRYRPAGSDQLPARWRSRQRNSCWHRTRTGYCHLGTADASDGARDWLCYHQWTCWPRPVPLRPRTAASPIVDNYGYNQDLARGPFHRVTDLMLCCQVHLGGNGLLRLRLAGHHGVYQLELDAAAGSCRIRSSGLTVAARRYRLPRRSFLVEFALCDRHLLAAIERQPVFWVPEPAGERKDVGTRVPPVAPAIGAAGTRVSVDRLRIYRDLYYVGPAGENEWQAVRPVPADTWFVLGDNVPNSRDSRFGTLVASQQLIGPVIAPRIFR